MATTSAQKEARRKYQAKVKRVYLDFYPSEAKLYNHLERQAQKQTYIKDLIRADMERQKSE